jgi:hypothetical protein
MRATAFENTLRSILSNYNNRCQSEEAYQANNKALMVKVAILLSRKKDASVIREMLNQ